MKLHYGCLARIGAVPWSIFEHELRDTRETMAADCLGFADVALVSIPPVHVIRARKATGMIRQRRWLAVQVNLSKPLHEWYTAVERAEPGRVVWSWPAAGVPIALGERPQRREPALLDEIVAHLPR